jgi:hypothetical protein
MLTPCQVTPDPYRSPGWLVQAADKWTRKGNKPWLALRQKSTSG